MSVYQRVTLFEALLQVHPALRRWPGRGLPGAGAVDRRRRAPGNGAGPAVFGWGNHGKMGKPWENDGKCALQLLQPFVDVGTFNKQKMP